MQEAINKKLEVIAITDHNTVSKCYEVIEKAKGSGLVVLPGVEITAMGGKGSVHILAIFDCGTRQETIHDMLVKIGIDSQKHGKAEAITDQSVPIVFKEIDDAGGVAIAAHVDETSGIICDCRGQQRMTYVMDKNLTALEYVQSGTPAFFDGNDPNYPRKLPCIQSSDAHSLQEIGRRLTHLKMDKPCLEGLRQAFLDPGSRIRTEPNDCLSSYSFISSVSVNGGFLDGQEIDFNENLNTLIGGRGSGKTTTIELIRFCLGYPSKVETLAARNAKMVGDVLREGQVTVTVNTKFGTTFKVQRKCGEHPVVYDAKGELVNTSPSALVQLICFGEGEIEFISFDPASQLALVDKFTNGADKFAEEEQKVLRQLNENSTAIDANDAELAALDSQCAEFNSVKLKLAELENMNFGNEIVQKKQRADEMYLLKKLKDASDGLSLRMNEFSTACREFFQVTHELPSDEMVLKLPNQDIVKQGIVDFNEISAHVSQNTEAELKFIETKKTLIESAISTLEARHNEQEKGVVELFKQLEALGQSDAARYYLDLQGKKTTLESVPGKIELVKFKISRLKENRTSLLTELKNMRKQHFIVRQECAKTLSLKLGSKICVEIIQGGDTANYNNSLAKALKQSHVQAKDIEKIVLSINPFELSEIIRKKDKQRLLNLNITDHCAEVILSYQPLIQKLYALEEVSLPDLALITLIVGGKKKTLDSVSLGQKCTTLLSLIMLDSEAPLILDTPEEGLDNMFVFDSVVKNLRAIKEKRQVIIATHNANIPVSGDAELIVSLDSDGLRGYTTCFGSIDEADMKVWVQQILEGGKEAFELRQKKYGY